LEETCVSSNHSLNDRFIQSKRIRYKEIGNYLLSFLFLCARACVRACVCVDACLWFKFNRHKYLFGLFCSTWISTFHAKQGPFHTFPCLWPETKSIIVLLHMSFLYRKWTLLNVKSSLMCNKTIIDLVSALKHKEVWTLLRVKSRNLYETEYNNYKTKFVIFIGLPRLFITYRDMINVFPKKFFVKNVKFEKGAIVNNYQKILKLILIRTK